MKTTGHLLAGCWFTSRFAGDLNGNSSVALRYVDVDGREEEEDGGLSSIFALKQTEVCGFAVRGNYLTSSFVYFCHGRMFFLKGNVLFFYWHNNRLNDFEFVCLAVTLK